MNLEKINMLLSEGLSITKVEQQLGYGKDTLRKKLNRHGYKFNKKSKQYEYLGESDKNKQPTVTSVVTTRIDPIQKEPVTEVVIPSYPLPFEENEIETLRRMIKEYKAREVIQCADNEDRGSLKNRNIRIYSEQYDQFADWCKNNNLTQADALYKAIELLMNTLK